MLPLSIGRQRQLCIGDRVVAAVARRSVPVVAVQGPRTGLAHTPDWDEVWQKGRYGYVAAFFYGVAFCGMRSVMETGQ